MDTHKKSLPKVLSPLQLVILTAIIDLVRECEDQFLLTPVGDVLCALVDAWSKLED